MFKNKHFILALLIAPILSIIAYFGTDMALSEKPHAAKEGETYKLASKSNCRYTSGLCDMENGDFKVKFRSEKLTKDSLELSLNAAYPLEGVKLSVVDDQQQNAQPIDMTRADQAGQTGTSLCQSQPPQRAGYESLSKPKARFTTAKHKQHL